MSIGVRKWSKPGKKLNHIHLFAALLIFSFWALFFFARSLKRNSTLAFVFNFINSAAITFAVMLLPQGLIASLQNVQGFNEKAFEAVHASDKQITSIRLNPSKLSIANCPLPIDQA